MPRLIALLLRRLLPAPAMAGCVVVCHLGFASVGAAAQTAAPLLHLALPGDTAPRPVTRADLLALPQHSYATSTLWTSAVPVFAGPTLHALLLGQGVDLDPSGTESAETILRLTALNGYHVDMPLAEVTPDAPLLAMTRDGVALTARDKGPVWVVHPYNADRRWRSEIVYARAIWQLTEIVVIPAALPR